MAEKFKIHSVGLLLERNNFVPLKNINENLIYIWDKNFKKDEVQEMIEQVKNTHDF